jgi:hypothetical protein
MKIRSGFVSNSSSSSFICSTKMNLDQVRNKLNIMVEMYNRLFDAQETFDSMFEDPYVISRINIEGYKKTISYFGGGRVAIGDTIINSTDDNSIPWMLHTAIEDLFHANRIHLG